MPGVSGSMPTSFPNVNPERRKSIRFRPAAPVIVHSLDTRVVMTLDDLGPGGFSVQSTNELPTGAVMRVKFSAPDGSWTTLLIAQSVYCRPNPDLPESQGFVTGFRFLNTDTPRTAASVSALIDRATAVVSFS
jgi:hypothetical protein